MSSKLRRARQSKVCKTNTQWIASKYLEGALTTPRSGGKGESRFFMGKSITFVFLAGLISLFLVSDNRAAAFAQGVYAQEPQPVYPQEPQPLPPLPASQQPVDTGQPVPVMSAAQLDNLVAPIALYPDPLLSQVLVASTYPLEVVEAYQWIQANPGLTGPALTQAAQQQNSDPSVQALVMFPNVLRQLNQDITWTTNLGNAYLAQPQDVMNSIQQLRLPAQPAA